MQNSTRLSVMTDSIKLELVLIESSTFVTTYDHQIARESIAHLVALIHSINKIDDKESS